MKCLFCELFLNIKAIFYFDALNKYFKFLDKKLVFFLFYFSMMKSKQKSRPNKSPPTSAQMMIFLIK